MTTPSWTLPLHPPTATRLLVVFGVTAALAACTTGTPQASPTSATPAPSTTTTASPSPSSTTDVPTASSTPAAPSAPPQEPAQEPTAPAPAPGTVDVVVTFSGWNAASSSIEVGAYAATLTPGTCTLRLTGPGGAMVTAEAPTVGDATTVSCDGLAVPAARLSSGSWSGVVEYTSPQASGRAQVEPMDVP